jgi:hypothetical protein
MEPLDDDGGFTSRKFIFCCVSGVVLVIVGILAGTVWPGLAGIYPTMIGAVLGLCGIHSTSNIADKFVAAKTAVTTAKPPTKAAIAKKPVVPADAEESS